MPGAAVQGAVLAGSPEAVETACADYGQALGTAFQVIDDVLDYEGDSAEMGKNLGDDLREGKATLPLIAAMQRGNAQQAALIRDAIEQGRQAMDQIAKRGRASGENYDVIIVGAGPAGFSASLAALEQLKATEPDALGGVFAAAGLSNAGSETIAPRSAGEKLTVKLWLATAKTKAKKEAA